jgi:hypothetical protein
LEESRNVKICSFLEKLAESLAPGEGGDLLRMSDLDPQAREDNNIKEADDNEVIDNLKDIYDQYAKQKMAFIDQVRIPSLLPRSWTYEQVMNKFSCSRHAVKEAHWMRNEQDFMFKREERPTTRQRVNPERIKHFIT